MAEMMRDDKFIGEKEQPPQFQDSFNSQEPIIGELINVSGHVQELDRNFGLWSLCAVSVFMCLL